MAELVITLWKIYKAFAIGFFPVCIPFLIEQYKQIFFSDDEN